MSVVFPATAKDDVAVSVPMVAVPMLAVLPVSVAIVAFVSVAIDEVSLCMTPVVIDANVAESPCVVEVAVTVLPPVIVVFPFNAVTPVTLREVGSVDELVIVSPWKLGAPVVCSARSCGEPV